MAIFNSFLSLYKHLYTYLATWNGQFEVENETNHSPLIPPKLQLKLSYICKKKHNHDESNDNLNRTMQINLGIEKEKVIYYSYLFSIFSAVATASKGSLLSVHGT